MQEEKKDQANRVFAGVMVAVLASIVFTSFLHFTFKYFHSRTQTTRFCCPDIVYNLYRVMNRTKDPCRQFYDYTCYAWRTHIFSSIRQQLQESVVFPMFQMRAIVIHGKEMPTPKLAKVVAYHYASCIQFGQQSLDIIVNSSVHAVFEKLLKNGLSPTSSRAVFLANAIILSAEYYLFFFIDFYYVNKWRTGTAAFYIDSNVYDVDSIRTATLDIAIPILNNHFRMKVDKNDVLSLITRIRGRHRDAEAATPESNMSSPWSAPFERLHELQPRIRQEVWASAFHLLGYVTNVTRVTVSKPSKTAHILGIIFADNRNRPEALALLILLTATSVENTIWKSNEFTKVAHICRRNIQAVTPLWDDILSKTLTSPQTDAVVRNIYQTALSAVKSEAFRLYKPSDHTMIDNILQNKILLVPSERELPDSRFGFSPNKGDHDDVTNSLHHCRNSLALFRYWVFYDRNLENSFFTSHTMLSRSVYNVSIISVDRYIYVPPAAYALLYFNESTDRFVNMALLGIQFVDNFWVAIVDNLHQTDMSNILRECQRISRAEASSMFHFLWLSIRTTAQASMDASWTTMMDTWGSSKVSPARIFYMLFFYQHVCSGRVNRKAAAQLSAYMRALPDFNGAFGCTKPTDSWLQRCDLRLHEAPYEIELFE